MKKIILVLCLFCFIFTGCCALEKRELKKQLNTIQQERIKNEQLLKNMEKVYQENLKKEQQIKKNLIKMETAVRQAISAAESAQVSAEAARETIENY